MKKRSSHRRSSVRKGALRNFAKFTEKHIWQSLFFIKISGLCLQLYQKRHSGKNFFRWILGNFYEHFLYRAPPWDCFLRKPKNQIKKKKKHTKTQLGEEKFCDFMVIFIISFFFTSSLHIWQRLPYIIENDSGEGLRGI